MSPTNLPKAAGLLIATMLCASGAVAEPPLAERFTPISDEVASNPSPNDWLMWRRTYDSRGYSPLDQINKRNIGNLQLAWAWTQELGNQEAAPLVRDGVMYLAQSNNVVHALDARTGNLLWEYRHPLPKLQGGYVKRQLVRARNSIARSMATGCFSPPVTRASSPSMPAPERSFGTSRSPTTTSGSITPQARWSCAARSLPASPAVRRPILAAAAS
jgi:hypothetical protein